jgi:hypothetical protein
MQALETSIATDGWIGAITVAADGETFDGSARVEKTAENGMLDNPIIVESDGTRPIVVKRVDIPSATDPRAVRLGVAANRIAELNLRYDPQTLTEISGEIDLSHLYYDDELDAILSAMPNADAWAGALGALPDGDRAPFQQMTFTLSDEQAEQVKAALDKAKRVSPFVDTGNENSNGNALARVCEVFLGQG